MPAKSRFTRLDAFTKTVEDARVRTTSGGIVTVTSLLVILWLVWGEWSEYRRVVVHPELMVDKGRGMQTTQQATSTRLTAAHVTAHPLRRMQQNLAAATHVLRFETPMPVSPGPLAVARTWNSASGSITRSILTSNDEKGAV
ncbi:hypothetical protein LTR28_012255 [Elasticomyces elasticus]|nr:hypothetical protein LTR28_012255 [Elasticomyces elasticus]